MLVNDETGKLDKKEVVVKTATTTPHDAIADKTQTTDLRFYNLDAITSDFDREVKRLLEDGGQGEPK